MNRLTRNVIFSLKNSHNIRTITSFVPRNTLANHEPSRLFKSVSNQMIFCEKSSMFATQTIRYSSTAIEISQFDYENFCEETLDEICDYIEELIDSTNHLTAADVVNNVRI